MNKTRFLTQLYSIIVERMNRLIIYLEATELTVAKQFTVLKITLCHDIC